MIKRFNLDEILEKEEDEAEVEQPAIVEKVSLSEIKAEKTAIEDESDEVIIDEILNTIADMSDEEKDEMIAYLKFHNDKLRKNIEELKNKKAEN